MKLIRSVDDFSEATRREGREGTRRSKCRKVDSTTYI